MRSDSALRLLYVLLGVDLILGLMTALLLFDVPETDAFAPSTSLATPSRADQSMVMPMPSPPPASATSADDAASPGLAESITPTATPNASSASPVDVIMATSAVTRLPAPTRPALVRNFVADVPLLDSAMDTALGVLSRDVIMRRGYALHSAGPGYDAPWIRDSFAWGMIPSDAGPQLVPYATSELRYWLAQQLPTGQWVSNPQSGYYDETAIMICAALEAYRVTGNRALLQQSIDRLRRGWSWLKANANGKESAYLLWTPLQTGGTSANQLPISIDWADQIARRNYAGQLNVLWYRATVSMAQIETIAGSAKEAARYANFAEQIRTDFNRLLWSQAGVEARHAAPVGPFGHYRSWYPSTRDYFELDTNLQAIIYGMADAAQAESIMTFVRAHRQYLLGSEGGRPPPAKTVYGDYAPEDYARIRFKIGDGIYHNAYWMSIGGLAARAFSQHGDRQTLTGLMLGLASAIRGANPSAPAAEWYSERGQSGGAVAYQWSARSYVNALYRAYLGVDDDWSNPRAENLYVNPLVGGLSGRIKHLGKTITVHTLGSGTYRHAVLNEQTTLSDNVIPEQLLVDGSVLDLYLSN